jgi:hypothetical protein
MNVKDLRPGAPTVEAGVLMVGRWCEYDSRVNNEDPKLLMKIDTQALLGDEPSNLCSFVTVHGAVMCFGRDKLVTPLDAQLTVNLDGKPLE